MSGPARSLVFLALWAAVGCATSPGMRAGPTGASVDLRLCDGMGVSNAPAADRQGRIVNFEPVANVHGVILARAPVQACVSSGFGPRRGYGGRGSVHEGVDLYTRSPAPVYAGGEGVVESVETLRGYGRTILIRHNGRVKTRYAHLSEYAPGLRRGARVRRGALIGQTGRTGNATAVHLHYEILVDGRPYDPLTVGGRFTAAPGS